MRIRLGTIADIQEVSKVYAESWRSTYEGLVPEAFVKGMSVEAAAKIFHESLQPNSYSYFFHVAEAEGRIVGFADGGKERSHPESGVGELYAIYLLPKFQRRGLGQKLLHEAVESLQAAGIDSMMVWVLGASPFKSFYEKMGGHPGPGTKTLEVSGKKIELISFAWNDLRKL